jgi:hypothetical protein
MSFEPHHGKNPAGRHLVLKPGHNRDRQADREPARRASRTLRQTATSSRPIRRFGYMKRVKN